MEQPTVLEQDMDFITKQSLPWKDMTGKVVLITGAAGLLPAYMVETLLRINEEIISENKCTIICLVRNIEKARRRFRKYSHRDDLKFLAQDVCCEIVIDGPVDYIIHAASQASPKYYGVDPVGTVLANVLGTYQVLELARQKFTKRVMYFSSAEVYGTLDNGIATEDSYGFIDPLAVRSCYAESKRMGETMAISWHHQFGIPVVIVRPFHTYGPGIDLKDGRVFSDFIADVFLGRDIVMKSEGTVTRAFCYLADAVAGFFTVLFKGRTGQAYNIGNDKTEISVLALAELLVSLFPDRGLAVKKIERNVGEYYLNNSVDKICPDISKAKNLGWVPSVGLSDGLTKTITWMQENLEYYQ